MPCKTVTVSGGQGEPPGNGGNGGNGGGGGDGYNRGLLLAGLGVIGVGVAISALSDNEDN